MTTENNNSAHLTEDELDEALLGMASANHSLHLASCPDCRAQLEQFHSTVALFSEASIGWSQARSNALNRDLKQHRTPFRFTAQTVWTSAATLVLLATITVGIELRQHSEASMAAKVEQRRIQSETNIARAANAENEIASDNAMLLQIDAAINNSEPSPQELYGIRSSLGTSTQKSQRTQVKD
jgi:hypothetical protein